MSHLDRPARRQGGCARLWQAAAAAAAAAVAQAAAEVLAAASCAGCSGDAAVTPAPAVQVSVWRGAVCMGGVLRKTQVVSLHDAGQTAHLSDLGTVAGTA